MSTIQEIVSIRFKKVLIVVFISTLASSSYSQIVNDSGNLYSKIGSIISTMPGDTGDDYGAPDSFQLITWENTLNQLLSGDYSSASDSANTIGYSLNHFTDTTFSPNREYYILERNDTNYWGTYVLYPNYCRSVVIESPHPKKDANTGHQGIHVFRETQSFFYCVSGTHRCNSTNYSSCSGTTTGCSTTSEPFKSSDSAHNTNSIFQKTTEVLFLNYPNTHFIQLHGFAKLSTDPYVILSNGTQETPSPDFLGTFKVKLQEADLSLTFKVAHLDLSWTRLRGFSNTQGRLINSSTDACNANATVTNGRFFHVEQEKTKLRDDATGWDKITYAVNNTFPCTYTSIQEENSMNEVRIFPNPTSEFITIEFPEIMTSIDVRLIDAVGQEIAQLHFNQVSQFELKINGAPGIYFVELNSSNGKKTRAKVMKR